MTTDRDTTRSGDAVPDDPTFSAPWQARAFAIAVALTDDDAQFEWAEFQRELVAEIERADATGDVAEDAAEDVAGDAAEDVAEDAAEDVAEDVAGDAAGGAASDAGDAFDSETTATDEAYYERWLAGLERLLTDRGLVDPDAFAERAAAFAAGDRDAHEFVTGDPRAHTDRLPDGHAEGGHGHEHGHADAHRHADAHGHADDHASHTTDHTHDHTDEHAESHAHHQTSDDHTTGGE